MRLGIMQPYFFPYLGYYDLIARSDRWVVFDTVKYVPKSWMNRNRILHPSTGWQYITVPVEKRGEGRIQDIALVDRDAARRRILGQLAHYRQGRAPYFSAVRALVDRCFAEAATDALTELNVRSLAVVCDYLGIAFDPVVFSTAGIALPPVDHPGGWALEIASALGACEYINPPNGRELFRPDDFAERDIRLTFTELVDFTYPCAPYAFVDRLSIVDVLMWNDPAAVREYLEARR